jgi:hypothetical protein
MCTTRRAGIGRLTGIVLGENRAMMRLLQRLGAAPQLTEDGEWRVALSTNPAHLPLTPPTKALRHYDHLLAGRSA